MILDSAKSEEHDGLVGPVTQSDARYQSEERFRGKIIKI